MLSKEQVQSYCENGYLHVPEVFSKAEVSELAGQLEWLMQNWASNEAGWTGPWRKIYMDEATEKKSKLVAMHDLQFYSSAWARGIQSPKLVAAMKELLGENVEFHHSTMHVKPPETGHPFPMHQDWAFYPHADGRYVDVLVHLDDTFHENGEIRFLRGSHKQGPLEHITQTPEGPCTPHLSTEAYKLADTVAVPAKAGDIVCFNINTIHGSHVNVTSEPRRLVRLGYRSPENKQTSGQSMGRPGLMVAGNRMRSQGQQPFSTECQSAAAAPETAGKKA
jgi:ectoine hydroxylase-related dioxygenase (phytanoyl-CoA dioxygenase family)